MERKNRMKLAFRMSSFYSHRSVRISFFFSPKGSPLFDQVNVPGRVKTEHRRSRENEREREGSRGDFSFFDATKHRQWTRVTTVAAAFATVFSPRTWHIETRRHRSKIAYRKIEVAQL